MKTNGLMRPPLLGSLSPFSRVTFSVLLIITCFSLISVAGILLALPLFGINLWNSMNMLSDLENPNSITVLKYLQIVQSIGLFIVPPLLAGLFFGGNPFHYLRLDKNPKLSWYLATIVVLAVSMPLLQWMITVNEQIVLPEFLEGVEAWIKVAEEEATRLTDSFLSGTSVGILLVNLMMIAVLPGIGEELMFRGLVQRLLSEWFRNNHVAIWVTAFLFGAIHMQFYGLFPRMMLGAFLGYLFLWSGSLWLPVFAHFLNNSFTVVLAWMANRDWIGPGWEEFGMTDSIFIILLSTLLTAVAVTVLSRLHSRPAA